MRAIRLDAGNFGWATEAIARKTRILRVVYSAVSNELVRTNTLVKGQIIEIDAQPFRLWYEQHYGTQLGKKREGHKPGAPTSAAAPAPTPSAKKETSKKGAAKKEAAKKPAAGKAAAKPAAKEGAKKEGEKKEGKEKAASTTTPAATLAAKKLLGLSIRKKKNLMHKQLVRERRAKRLAEQKDKPRKDGKPKKPAQVPNPNKKPKLNKAGKPKAVRTFSQRRQAAARRTRVAPLDTHLAEQFLQGRLYACIASRPGQDGCADGYILEGKELEFYLRKLQKKKTTAK